MLKHFTYLLILYINPNLSVCLFLISLFLMHGHIFSKSRPNLACGIFTSQRARMVAGGKFGTDRIAGSRGTAVAILITIQAVMYLPQCGG